MYFSCPRQRRKKPKQKKPYIKHNIKSKNEKEEEWKKKTLKEKKNKTKNEKRKNERRLASKLTITRITFLYSLRNQSIFIQHQIVFLAGELSACRLRSGVACAQMLVTSLDNLVMETRQGENTLSRDFRLLIFFQSHSILHRGY